MTYIPSDYSTTARLLPGWGVDGAIDFAGDTDLFRVDLEAGRSYAFDMFGADSGFMLDDPLLSLLDADLNPIASDDDSGLGLDARIDHTAIATGTYYLRAAALGAIGSYHLRMTDTAGRIDDHGNSPVNADTLAIGGSQAGTVDFLGDRDWFRVDLNRGQTYVFTVRGGSSAGDLFDPHLALYDAAGHLLDRNDDAAPDTLDARITFTAASSGAYYLDAGALGDLTGRYVIAADGPAAPTPVTPVPDPSVIAPATPEPSVQPPATPEPTPVPVAPTPVTTPPVTTPPVTTPPVTPVLNVQAGTAGDDAFVARAGDDLILGGAGSDTITYAGLARSYGRAVSEGWGTITGGPEGGTDTLESIETIRFADGYVTSDPASHAAQVHRLYTLILERMPDSLGLNSWTQSLDRGSSLVGVANGFAASWEFQTKTAGLSTSDFVEFLYNNALGRASDAAGKAGWVGAIDSGSHSRGEVIVGFSESVEYQSLVNGHLSDGLFIYDDTYAAVASLYDAFADRRPDAAGLENWVNVARYGHYSMEQIADGFANSPEFRAQIDGLDARGIVQQLYRNVLGREGEAEGVAGWTAKLEADHDLGSLLWGFASSTEHQVLMQPYLADGVVVL